MPLKLSDLPPAARERALRAAGTPAERKKASRKGTSDAQPCAGSCSGCGETFDRYTAWERHHDAGCVGRWVINLAQGV